jgi:hypothetical protein
VITVAVNVASALPPWSDSLVASGRLSLLGVPGLLGLTPGVAQAVMPPLMRIVCAVIHCASGVQRNAISGTISSHSPSRPAPLIRLAALKDCSVSTPK